MRCDLQSESEYVQNSYEDWAQQAIRDDAIKERDSTQFVKPKGKIYEMSLTSPRRASNHHTTRKAS
jgi:hypothetical protein